LVSSESTIVEPASLSISCVTYNLDKRIFSATIESLALACAYAKEQNKLTHTHLYLIDNGPAGQNHCDLLTIQNSFNHCFDKVTLLSGHGNLGYGGGNNIALKQTNCRYHLVLNPDVLLAQNNVSIALDYMSSHEDVGLLAPDATGESGERQYLAKRMPSFVVLFSRAVNINFLRTRITDKLHHYEYRDLIPAQQPIDIELASGCYMFLRTRVAQQINGFDPNFFMYFEDFDLSRRISKMSRVVHHPELKIVHYGGGASRKGLLHFGYFVTSFGRFLLKNRYF
jgi:GT2 family glycosyltransferase